MDQMSQGMPGTETSGTVRSKDVVSVSPEPTDVQAKELAGRIKRLIRRRTGGGIYQLRVDVGPESILLSGRCTTFYCKQLAQQAAMLLRGPRRIDDQVVVTYTD